MRSPRFVLIVGCAAIAVAGCASTLDGEGQATGARSSGTRHDFPSGSPQPSGSSVSPGPSSPTATSAPAQFQRTPASTAIGDPPTVDLCSAIQISDYAQPGYSPAPVDSQSPPGCNVRLNKSDGSHVTLTVYGATQPTSVTTGRTAKKISGLTVYSYPFQPSLGECERDVVASGITLVVTSVTIKGSTNNTPSRTVNCTGTDLLAAKMAAAVTGRRFSAMKLASPSLIALDACKVATAAGWPSLSAFGNSTPKPDAFGAGCNFTITDGYVYIDPEVSAKATVDAAKPVSVNGHTIYAATYNDASNCTYTSVQGTTSNGRSERLYFSAYTSKRVPQFCSQMSSALGRYLTVAGLR